jgi:cell division protein FtsZ
MHNSPATSRPDPATCPGPPTPTLGARAFSIKVIGLGGAGANAVNHMAREKLTGVSFLALNTDAQALAPLEIQDKHVLGTSVTRGLGTGGDCELGRTAALSEEARLRELCVGADIVFILAGLGGGTGTGAAPVLARIAKEAGALVLGIVTLPFQYEGVRRQQQAQDGLAELKAAADGVICLPNQKVVQLISEHASFVETFKFTNDLLAQAVRSIWRLVSRTGLINLDFADICAVIRGRHGESALATAEAQGENRAVEVVDRLLVNPLLDGGQALGTADAVLLSVAGGPDLTMGEVHRVMEQINRQCGNAHIIMGAIIDERFTGHLAVTVIAGRQGDEIPAQERPADPAAPESATPDRLRGSGGPVSEEKEFDTHFLSRAATGRPASRFVAPPPALSDTQKREMLARQEAAAGPRARRKSPRMQQGQLPLEILTKGRFEKSEPTIHQGEDLDVPTYIRRGIPLN